MRVTVLLISGNRSEAVQAVIKKFMHISENEVEIVDLKTLASAGIFSLVKGVRSHSSDHTAIYCQDLDLQGRMFFIYLLGLMAKGKNKVLMDGRRRELALSLVNFVFLELPKAAFELACSTLIVSIAFILLGLLQVLVRRDRSYVSKFRKGTEKRVGYLRTDFWFNLVAGGSITHTIGVCKGFADSGYEVLFLSSSNMHEAIGNLAHVYVIVPKVFRYMSMEISQVYYNFKFFVGAVRLMRKKKPAFLYQRASTLNCTGVLLSIILRVPLFLEVNSSAFWGKLTSDRIRYRLLKLLFEKVNLKGACKLIVVSDGLKRRITKFGINADKVIVNPNGVDPAMFSPTIESSGALGKLKQKIIVGFVGVFQDWHGVITLARAVKGVVSVNRNVHFLFIGDGHLSEEMKTIVCRDGVEESVTFTGLVPYKLVPSYLSACSILVSPHQNMFDGSTFFGSPTKLFEYMATGKGIVASDVGQMSEVLKNNINAILVPPGDVRFLEEEICRLANDEALRKRLGQRAREDVLLNYTWLKNVERVTKAYQNLLGPKP
jgi:glycosyltransferase involved in cell wall biosynthesis